MTLYERISDTPYFQVIDAIEEASSSALKKQEEDRLEMLRKAELAAKERQRKLEMDRQIQMQNQIQRQFISSAAQQGQNFGGLGFPQQHGQSGPSLPPSTSSSTLGSSNSATGPVFIQSIALIPDWGWGTEILSIRYIRNPVYPNTED